MTRTDEQGLYRFEDLIAGLVYSIRWEARKPFTAEGGETPRVVDIYLEE